MFEFDAKSLAKLQTKLEKTYPREAAKQGRALVKKVVTELRNNIKAAAPVDTGTLKKAIYIKVLRDKFGEPTAGDVRVKGSAFYWRFIEHGTVNRPATPFIGPTIERFRPKLEAYFKEHMRNLADEFNKE